VRREPWTPEVEIKKPVLELPVNELRRISEEYEINMEKLEAIIQELNEVGGT